MPRVLVLLAPQNFQSEESRDKGVSYLKLKGSKLGLIAIVLVVVAGLVVGAMWHSGTSTQTSDDPPPDSVLRITYTVRIVSVDGWVTLEITWENLNENKVA